MCKFIEVTTKDLVKVVLNTAEILSFADSDVNGYIILELNPLHGKINHLFVTNTYEELKHAVGAITA